MSTAIEYQTLATIGVASSVFLAIMAMLLGFAMADRLRRIRRSQ